jgi:hypothetical protein
MQNTPLKHTIRLDMSITRKQAVAIQNDADARTRLNDDLIELAREVFIKSRGNLNIIKEHTPNLCFYSTANGGMEVVDNFRLAPETFKFYALVRFEYSPVDQEEKATVVQEKKAKPRRKIAA